MPIRRQWRNRPEERVGPARLSSIQFRHRIEHRPPHTPSGPVSQRTADSSPSQSQQGNAATLLFGKPGNSASALYLRYTGAGQAHAEGGIQKMPTNGYNPRPNNTLLQNPMYIITEPTNPSQELYPQPPGRRGAAPSLS